MKSKSNFKNLFSLEKNIRKEFPIACLSLNDEENTTYFLAKFYDETNKQDSFTVKTFKLKNYEEKIFTSLNEAQRYYRSLQF